MEMTLEHFKNATLVANRIDALKTLAKLLLYEVESLAENSSPPKEFSDEKPLNLSDEVQRYEINLICEALLLANGNQRKAAKILGMKTTTLHSKIKRYEIDSFSLAGQFTADEN